MSLFTTSIPGPQPVAQVAKDIIRRGLIVGPLLLIVGGSIWGLAGLSSTAYGIGLVLVNFAMAAAFITYTSRISLGLLMVSVMFGFLIRLGLIFLAFWLAKDAGWMHPIALGMTIIVTHLGLLVWELRFVSASLAYPGLKPKKSKFGKSSWNFRKQKGDSKVEILDERETKESVKND